MQSVCPPDMASKGQAQETAANKEVNASVGGRGGTSAH